MTAIRFFAAALALMFSFSVAAQDAPAPPAKKVVLLAGATGTILLNVKAALRLGRMALYR